MSVHATLCSILSDAVEGGFLTHNPAWRTYRCAGRKNEKKIADAETVAGILGYNQPSTTLDIYTHAFDKNKQTASVKLQKGLEI